MGGRAQGQYYTVLAEVMLNCGDDGAYDSFRGDVAVAAPRALVRHPGLHPAVRMTEEALALLAAVGAEGQP